MQLTGRIGGVAVDALVDLDEVQPANILQFPDSQPDLVELKAQLEETQAQLRMANLIAIAGLVMGLIGVGIAIFSLTRRSKKL
ncbi:MAG: hypothetical protein HC806_02350, partial [Anaerolineae bacterium]|nr:hypothetical protein [Anaerolineae bacterium]